MTLLDRHIVRAILAATAMVMAVLLVLGALFTFIAEQQDVGQGHYTALSAVWYSLLSLPQEAWELLPIAAVIGSLLGLGTLARGNEITVMRASGVSIARIAGSALVAGFVLIALEVILGEALAPQLQQTARREKAFERFNNVSFGNNVAWVRDHDQILNVQQQAGTRRFGGMLVFELTPDHHLQSIGTATQALALGNARWRLSGYAESRFTPERVIAESAGQRTMESHVTAGFLGLAATEPRELRAPELWQLIQYYRANSLDPRPYVFAFWSRIARTVAIAFAVLLAVPFVLGALRAAGSGTRLMVGLLLGLGFFLLQRLIESGTVVFGLNPIVLAWLPAGLLALVALTLLARAR
jgi:lipopolysaccharide export system permease protein